MRREGLVTVKKTGEDGGCQRPYRSLLKSVSNGEEKFLDARED